MQIFHNLNEWITTRRMLPSELTIGFVPTMGNLHIAHASLYQASRQENACTVASLFINPTQFDRKDDLTHYPRTLEADLALLTELGVDYCILPTEKDMYADGYRYQLQETEMSQVLEGEYRPGHFNGVLTVVMKLFQLVKPHTAYFGEKDYQQYRLIQGMSDAFFLGVTVKGCPTIREASGLPYSSRNNRLTPAQRLEAEKFARIFHQQHKSSEAIATELTQENILVQYIRDHQGRRFAAVMIGDIRLIDNYSLEPTAELISCL